MLLCKNSTIDTDINYQLQAFEGYYSNFKMLLSFFDVNYRWCHIAYLKTN